MAGFEILCVTMNQSDFNKIREMNVKSNVVFANQCNRTGYDEINHGSHYAKMISTQTRGVGVNRNLAIMYASADICLLADDDVVYNDDMENVVVSEFDAHPDADVIIFHFDSNDNHRSQVRYHKTRRCGFFSRTPWPTFRIAIRLSSLRKANVWFTTLFGGGATFPSGEDSMFLTDLRKKGLKLYVSKETIGKVSFKQSTWFTGFDAKYYYGKGVFYQAVRPKLKLLWVLYFLVRSQSHKELSIMDKIKWMVFGFEGYKRNLSYNEFAEFINESSSNYLVRRK